MDGTNFLLSRSVRFVFSVSEHHRPYVWSNYSSTSSIRRTVHHIGQDIAGLVIAPTLYAKLVFTVLGFYSMLVNFNRHNFVFD